MARKLTPLAVDKAKPHPIKRREIADPGKPGLYLVVQPSGRKSWAVRYRHKGRPRKLTIEGFPSLATARKLAQTALDRAAEGLDPAGEKQNAKRARTAGESDIFRDIAAQFVERHVKRNTRVSSARETERLLNKEVLPKWGKKRVQDITKRHVLDLLEDIVVRGGGLTANRALSAIRKLFNWATQQDIIDVSPVARIRPLLIERSRDRILSNEEIRWLWKACECVGYPFGPFVQLLLLTGQRRREVAGMRYAELDLNNRAWTIPGERSKNGNPHEVPLSDAALAILGLVPRIGNMQGYVFTSRADRHVSGYSQAKSAIDKAMIAMARDDAGQSREDSVKVEIPRWTFHDLRRTTASGMARLAIALPVIEKVLNHSSGSFAGIVSVYQRHSFADEKRRALDAWASFVRSVAQEPASNVVVQLRDAG